MAPGGDKTDYLHNLRGPSDHTNQQQHNYSTALLLSSSAFLRCISRHLSQSHTQIQTQRHTHTVWGSIVTSISPSPPKRSPSLLYLPIRSASLMRLPDVPITQLFLFLLTLFSTESLVNDCTHGSITILDSILVRQKHYRNLSQNMLKCSLQIFYPLKPPLCLTAFLYCTPLGSPCSSPSVPQEMTGNANKKWLLLDWARH